MAARLPRKPGRTHHAVLAMAFALTPDATHAQDAPVVDPPCIADLTNPGVLADILSNALMHGLERPEQDVRRFLTGAQSGSVTAEGLVDAAARHFDVTHAALTVELVAFQHWTCDHDGDGRPDGDDPDGGDRGDGAAGFGDTDDIELSAFARDVSVHVVLHELGHALVREFDLPVLANEEAAADAFATHYVTAHMPDRAADVLAARVTSLMIEAREVPRAEWDVSGEHHSDARRAHQIVALALAADAAAYEHLVPLVDMSPDDVRSARDYGTEIHRSWRRLLAPLWMTDGTPSRETRLDDDAEDPVLRALTDDGTTAELMDALRRFDWHSQVTLRLHDGEGSAGWSRSSRTLDLPAGYVRRFVRQGQRAAAEADAPNAGSDGSR